MIENTVKLIDKAVNLSDQPVKTAVKSVDQGWIKPTNIHDFNIKAARNLENNRYGMVKITTTIIITVICLILTLQDAPARVQICVYMIAIAIILLLDTAQVFTRLLAKQSRWIIASVLIMIVVGIIKQHRNYSIVVTMITILLMVFIYFMNSRWLAADNWMMSEAAQAALNPDLDNTATRAWQTHGRREIRTLMYELGYSVNDDLLDITCKPIYIAGYLNGFEKTSKQKSRIQAAEESAEIAKQQVADLQNQLTRSQQTERNALQELDEISTQLRESMEQQMYWQKLYKQEHRLVEKLTVANEEIVSELPDPDEVVIAKGNLQNIKGQSRDEKIQAALDAGMSYRDAAKFAGCSHGTVNNFVKRKQQENVAKIIPISVNR